MEWILWAWYGWLGLAGTLLINVIIRSIVLLKYQPSVNTQPVPVSVVIAARNEGEKLEQLVDRIMQQNHPDFELQIVLDRCSDNSLDIMKSLELKHKNLRTQIVDYLPDHFSPKKFALTLGIKGAKHECVLLTDADCLPHSEKWIDLMTESFSDQTDFVIGFSPYHLSTGLLGRYINYETFVSGFNFLTNVLLSKPSMAVGRNLVIRKSTFLKVNGYNKFQHVQGGDDDLMIQHHATRNNTQIRWEPESQTTSPPKTSWSEYYLQKIRHLSVGKYYRLGSKLAHSINWIAHLSLWLSFLILALLRPDFFALYISFFGYHLIKGLTYGMVKRKMDNGYSIWSFPIMELVHLFLMPVFTIGARVTTKVKWK